MVDPLLDRLSVLADEDVERRRAGGAFPLDRAVEGEVDGLLGVRLPTVELLEIDPERSRGLLGLRLADERVAQLLAGRVERPLLASDRARHVIPAAQVVEDRAADPRRGEGAEREAARGVEVLDRVDEPDRPGAD